VCPRIPFDIDRRAALQLLAGPLIVAPHAKGAAEVGGAARFQPRASQVLHRHSAPEADQAVAVDRTHFYAIGSAAIGKYNKTTGMRTAGWEESKKGRVRHLNSGIVSDRWLFCAHSNYPQVPMESSVEVFEIASMKHLYSIPLPRGRGSATWVERLGARWWVTFAHYAGKGGEAGKGPEATTLVRFSDGWRPQRIWSFPPDLVRRWDGMSSSGGVWARPDRLYTTGHHAPELYVLDVPDSARELTLREVVAIESEGQGIALDRDEHLLYSIQRRTREVLVSRLPDPL
jgi:hypothetical protein